MARRTWATVAGLTALAFGLRLAQIDQSLFGDELFLHRIVAGHDLGQALRLVHDTESTPPLHFVLAWLCAQIGDPTVWIRVPSLVAGTLTVPAVFALGRRTVGHRAGLAGAMIVAIAPYTILYGVEGRAYALLGLLSALSTLALLRALDAPSTRRWVVYGLAATAILYTHYVGFFVLAAQGAWAAWRHRERLRELALTHAAVALAYVPWIPSFLVQRQDSAAVRIERNYPLTLESIGRGFLEVLPGDPYFPLRGQPGRAAVVVFVVAAATAVGLAVARWPRWRSGARPRCLELLALLALVTPVAALLYGLGPESIFLPRNLIPSLPAAVLLLGAAVVHAGRVAGPVLGAALGVVLAIGAVKTFDADFQRPPYREAADYVEDHGRAGDAVLDVSIAVATPLGGGLAVHLDRRFELAEVGHRGTSAVLARARARGRLFLVVPQVGVLAGTPRFPLLRGFRLTGRHELPARLTVFVYGPAK